MIYFWLIDLFSWHTLECSCDPRGTEVSKCPAGSLCFCDQETGQCPCRPGVEGALCNECVDGYWNLDGESGCQPCNCEPEHALSNVCDKVNALHFYNKVTDMDSNDRFQLPHLFYSTFFRSQGNASVRQSMEADNVMSVDPTTLETRISSACVRIICTVHFCAIKHLLELF